MKYPKRCQYKHAKQKKYHVRNWAEYNEGLRRRGDLTVWFDEEAIANWKADKTGEPGGQRVYSDMAIETGLVVRMVYKLAYRQTEGFLHSIASLLGLGIEIPEYLFTADAGVGAGQKRPPRLSYSACSGPGGSRFANWANGLNGLRASWVD